MAQTFDLSIYLIGSMAYGIKKIEEALAAGVTLFQLREKNISSRQYLDYAKQIKACTSYYGVPLIINDRVDIALLSGAEGVHLGQSDVPIADVRALVGNDFIIGATAKTLETALEAEKQGAHYIGCGAWFETSTKLDATVLEHESYRKIKQQLTIPGVAIGGITVENCRIPLSYGVEGIAMASGILGSQNITETVKQLSETIKTIKN